MFTSLTFLDFTYSWFSSKTIFFLTLWVCGKLLIFHLVLCMYFTGLCPSGLLLPSAIYFNYIFSSVAMKLLSTTGYPIQYQLTVKISCLRENMLWCLTCFTARLMISMAKIVFSKYHIFCIAK